MTFMFHKLNAIACDEHNRNQCDGANKCSRHADCHDLCDETDDEGNMVKPRQSWKI
mgnify:CR=1 FL=1